MILITGYSFVVFQISGITMCTKISCETPIVGFYVMYYIYFNTHDALCSSNKLQVA